VAQVPEQVPVAQVPEQVPVAQVPEQVARVPGQARVVLVPGLARVAQVPALVRVVLVPALAQVVLVPARVGEARRAQATGRAQEWAPAPVPGGLAAREWSATHRRPCREGFRAPGSLAPSAAAVRVVRPSGGQDWKGLLVASSRRRKRVELRTRLPQRLSMQFWNESFPCRAMSCPCAARYCPCLPVVSCSPLPMSA